MERVISLPIVLLLGVFRKHVVVAVVLEVVCPVDDTRLIQFYPISNLRKIDVVLPLLRGEP